jgi:uncharacterized protein (TIGR02594 family)
MGRHPDDPVWLVEAQKYIGTKPVPIVRRAWCANFVRGCLEFSGIPAPCSKKSRAYLDWGLELPFPKRGCIVVFWRKRPEGTLGHVGFFLGYSKTGNLRILGGNQNDTVCVASYPKNRVLGYRWPKENNITNGLVRWI